MIRLSSIRFHSDSASVLDAEEVVYNFKSFLSLRKVNAADIHARLELALRMVPQEGKDGDNGARCDVQGQLVFEN